MAETLYSYMNVAQPSTVPNLLTGGVSSNQVQDRALDAQTAANMAYSQGLNLQGALAQNQANMFIDPQRSAPNQSWGMAPSMGYPMNPAAAPPIATIAPAPLSTSFMAFQQPAPVWNPADYSASIAASLEYGRQQEAYAAAQRAAQQQAQQPQLAPLQGGISQSGQIAPINAYASASAQTGPINVNVAQSGGETARKLGPMDALGMINGLKAPPPNIPGMSPPQNPNFIAPASPTNVPGMAPFSANTNISAPVGSGISAPTGLDKSFFDNGGGGGGNPLTGGVESNRHIVPQDDLGGGGSGKLSPTGPRSTGAPPQQGRPTPPMSGPQGAGMGGPMGGGAAMPPGMQSMMQGGPPPGMMGARPSAGQMAMAPGSMATADASGQVPRGAGGNAKPAPMMVPPPPKEMGLVAQTPRTAPTEGEGAAADYSVTPDGTLKPSQPTAIDAEQLGKLDASINQTQQRVNMLSGRQDFLMAAYNTPEYRERYNRMRAHEARAGAWQMLSQEERDILGDPEWGKPPQQAPLKPYQIGEYLRRRDPAYAKTANPQAVAYQQWQLNTKQEIMKHVYENQKLFLDRSLEKDIEQTAKELHEATGDVKELWKAREGFVAKERARETKIDLHNDTQTNINNRRDKTLKQQDEHFDETLQLNKNKVQQRERFHNDSEKHATVGDEIKRGNLSERKTSNKIAQQNADTAGRNADSKERSVEVSEKLAPHRAASIDSATARNWSDAMKKMSSDDFYNFSRRLNPKMTDEEIDHSWAELQKEMNGKVVQSAQVDNTDYNAPAPKPFKNNAAVGKAGGVDKVFQPDEKEGLDWYHANPNEVRRQKFTKKFGYDPRKG